MLSRIQCALLALFSFACLAGCAEGEHVGDWLWWPGLTPITSAYVDQIPVHDVALEVQCEIYKFLTEVQNQEILDPKRGAGVVLTLQTDLSGSVQYTGINLSKLGAPSLAELVTASNKVPTLQAKGVGSATVSAEVDFTVGQALHTPDEWKKPPQKTNPQAIIKKSELYEPKDNGTSENGPIWEKAEFKSKDENDPKNPELKAEPPKPTSAKPKSQQPRQVTVPHADCDRWFFRTPYNLYLKLSLDDWLKRYSAYSANLYTGQGYYLQQEPFVCGTKITLRSSFKLLFDVSAGVNAFMAPPIILPISGFNVDASPDYTHSIAVTFALKDRQNKAYCDKIGAGAQPSVK